MILFVIFNIILTNIVFCNSATEWEDLTTNFFDNLKVDPYILVDTELSLKSKEFIDRQIENFKLLIRKSRENKDRSKRSLLDDFYGNLTRVGVSPINSVPSKFPKEIKLFHQNSNWYAASLESSANKEIVDKLVIYKFEDDKFKEIVRKNITNGIAIGIQDLDYYSIIVVGDNCWKNEEFKDKSKIYNFTFDENLVPLQTIDTEFITDVAIWKTYNNVYMILAQHMTLSSGVFTYDLKIPIYVWKGNHFDIIQHILVTGVKKIVPFSINYDNYLAIANSRTDKGNKKTYSEVFKYNIETEMFEPYQRIMTENCEDMKYFSLSNSNSNEEHFLIATNNRKGINGEKHPESILYKYIDGYFLPFQSIQIDAFKWEALQGENALLSVSHINGLTLFKYDGWQFRQAHFKSDSKLLQKSIQSVQYYKFNNMSTLVVSNSMNDGSEKNMFFILFKNHNFIENQRKQLLSWCEESIKKLVTPEYIEVNTILGRQMRGDVEELSESLVWDNEASMKNNFDELDSPDGVKDAVRDKMRSSLDSFRFTLEDVESKVQNSVREDINNIINQELEADEVIINSEAFIDSLHSNSICGLESDNLLKNVLNVNEGFEIKKDVKFNFLRISGPIIANRINENSPNDLIRKDEHLDFSNLKALAIKSSKIVTNNLNDVNATSKNLLLKNTDQEFSQLVVNNIEVNNLQTKFLNNLDVESSKKLLTNKTNMKHISTLRAKNLVIGGYINDLHIPTLHKFTLKTFGDQTISKTYFFDEIETENIHSETLSHTNPEDLVKINEGKYNLPKDILFTEDMKVGNLTAKRFLDSISVKENGKLDILLKKSNDLQYISGDNVIEYMELINPIKLQGKIRSKNLEKMRRVVSLDEDLEIPHDVKLTGNIIIEDLLNVIDIKSANNQLLTLSRLINQGVKLGDNNIPPHLKFTQQLNVDEIFVDKINNISPDSWVINGNNITQVVEGWKQFLGDVEITGSTDVFRMNDITVSDLESNTFTIQGNQTVTGKHSIKFVVNEGKTISNNILFGEHPWAEVLTTNTEQVIIGTTIVNNNLLSNSTTANALQINGRINDLNFNELVQDSVSKNHNNTIISGHKTFKNFTIENLFVHSNNMDPVDTINVLRNGEFNLNITQNMDDIKISNVENIYFTDMCNGVSKQDFKDKSYNKNNTHIINVEKSLEKITIFGRAFIKDNRLNNVDISEVYKKSVKVDEPFEFFTANFGENLVVKDTVHLDGHIENIDIDNIIESNSIKQQNILGDKVFYKNVLIDGNIYVNSNINNVDISQYCNMFDNNPKKLTINGNVHFSKGPDVFKINENNVQFLSESVWHTNKEVILHGYIEFGNVTFLNDVTVQGYTDNVNLEILKNNYFSKSLDQNITATLEFTDGIVFENDISTPLLKTEGNVNGVNIKDFTQNAILDSCSQVFENVPYFENVQINDLQGNYKVNDLNLENEVMRYDKTNMVIGPKHVRNVEICILKMDKNINVQNVDVLHWMQNSVLRSGSHNIVGKKTITSANFVNGLSVEGLLNDLTFTEDDILLKKSSQTVTGKKTFYREEYSPIIFKTSKLRGLINDIEFAEMVKRQAYKNSDNIFKNDMSIHRNFYAENLNINHLYQGINISTLLSNVTKLGALNNFVDNYNLLMDMSLQVRDSIEGRANYVEHYKVIQKFYGIDNIYMLKYEDRSKFLLVPTNVNGSLLMEVFNWNRNDSQFINTGYTINFGQYPSYINDITFGNKHCLYVESKADETNDYVGKLIHFKKSTSSEVLHQISTNGTNFVTSFLIPSSKQNCLLFISITYEVNIVCDENGEMYLYQTLDGVVAEKVSVFNTRDTTCIVVMNKGMNHENNWISVWTYNKNTYNFKLHQTIYEEEPTSFSTVHFENVHFLAVTSGYLQNTMYFGGISIKRFNENTNTFENWQNINLEVPVQVEFAVLPSKELVLYVVSGKPTEPLVIYMYEGTSKFVQKIVGSTILTTTSIKILFNDGEHFITTSHTNYVSVIQAILKGDKYLP